MRKARDARHGRRLQAVWLVAQGYGAREVARLLGASERWVNKWLARYLVRRRPDNLAEAMRPGRPRADDVLTKKRIVTTLRSDPLKWGYSSTVWTVPLLTMHFRRECGTFFSERTVRRRIREVGFRWKRPRYVFAKRDPHRAQKKGGSSAG
ncbi:helix-turn-helix domain-containing protein [Verrucomicrobiota bacterium sgz303538]